MAETVVNPPASGATGSVVATHRYAWGVDLGGTWETGMGNHGPGRSQTAAAGVGALLGGKSDQKYLECCPEIRVKFICQGEDANTLHNGAMTWSTYSFSPTGGTTVSGINRSINFGQLPGGQPVGRLPKYPSCGSEFRIKQVR